MFELVGGLVGVAVGSAEGFGDDGVDDAEGFEVFAGEFEAFGELGGGGVVFVEDGGAGFGGDDGVPGEFEHGDFVGYADAECAAGAAFAGDDGDDGCFEAGHFEEVSGDGFGLAAFFGADAGVGAGGVDEGDDGEAELFGEFHAAEGFAVALGVCEAEEALDFFFGVAAFVVADEHDFVAAEAGESAADGVVVAVVAVAVDLAELAADHFDVIFEEGALGVAGDLDGFPGGEVFVGFAEEGGVVFAEAADFGGAVDVAEVLLGFEFGDLFFEFGEGFFEFEDLASAADGAGGGWGGGRGGVGGGGGGRDGWDGQCFCHSNFQCTRRGGWGGARGVSLSPPPSTSTVKGKGKGGVGGARKG